MKLIKAIIRSEKLTEVLNALYEADVYGLTVSRVRGHGGEKEKVEIYRGTKYKHELNDKVAIEIGVSEPFVDKTVQTLMAAARTGEIGDGKIFVLPVDHIYRIRTGEIDSSAVTPVK